MIAEKDLVRFSNFKDGSQLLFKDLLEETQTHLLQYYTCDDLIFLEREYGLEYALSTLIKQGEKYSICKSEKVLTLLKICEDYQNRLKRFQWCFTFFYENNRMGHNSTLKEMIEEYSNDELCNSYVGGTEAFLTYEEASLIRNDVLDKMYLAEKPPTLGAIDSLAAIVAVTVKNEVTYDESVDEKEKHSDDIHDDVVSIGYQSLSGFLACSINSRHKLLCKYPKLNKLTKLEIVEYDSLKFEDIITSPSSIDEDLFFSEFSKKDIKTFVLVVYFGFNSNHMSDMIMNFVKKFKERIKSIVVVYADKGLLTGLGHHGCQAVMYEKNLVETGNWSDYLKFFFQEGYHDVQLKYHAFNPYYYKYFYEGKWMQTEAYRLYLSNMSYTLKSASLVVYRRKKPRWRSEVKVFRFLPVFGEIEHDMFHADWMHYAEDKGISNMLLHAEGRTMCLFDHFYFILKKHSNEMLEYAVRQLNRDRLVIIINTRHDLVRIYKGIPGKSHDATLVTAREKISVQFKNCTEVVLGLRPIEDIVKAAWFSDVHMYENCPYQLCFGPVRDGKQSSIIDYVMKARQKKNEKHNNRSGGDTTRGIKWLSGFKISQTNVGWKGLDESDLVIGDWHKKRIKLYAHYDDDVHEDSDEGQIVPVPRET